MQSWIRPIVQQLEVAPEAVAGPAISCSSMVGPSIALIGDAGHTFTPAYGLGVNEAMRDAFVLSEALKSSSENVPEALETYNSRRHGDMESLHKIEEVW